MIICSLARFCRTPLVAALGFFAGSLLPAHAQADNPADCPTVSISGSPAAPVTIPLNQNYSITATVTAHGPWYANKLMLQGCQGTTDSPSGSWVFKGEYDWQPPMLQSQTLTNTWTVANQAPGNFWWRAGGQDNYANPIWYYSNYIGAYISTPPATGGGGAM